MEADHDTVVPYSPLPPSTPPPLSPLPLPMSDVWVTSSSTSIYQSKVLALRSLLDTISQEIVSITHGLPVPMYGYERAVSLMLAYSRTHLGDMEAYLAEADGCLERADGFIGDLQQVESQLDELPETS
jgi:hypothetical protein